MDNKENIEELLRRYASEGCRYRMLHQYDKVNIIADKILLLQEKNANGHDLKITALIALELYQDALEYLDKLLNLQVDIYGLYEMKGKILTSLKKYHEANEYFNVAYEKEEYDMETRVEHAKVLMEIGEYSKALHLCEYAKRNEINSFDFGEDEVKVAIHKKIISDMETEGVFGHKYSFQNMENFQYILIDNEFIKIIIPGKDIILDSKGDRIIERKEFMTIAELKDSFKDVRDSNLLESITSNFEFQYYYELNDETKVKVAPVHYLTPGDTMVSSYFTSNYEYDYYEFEDNMYEVLFGGECLGYVLKK